MTDRTRKTTRMAIGYGVIAVGLYLMYLTGSSDFSLGGYAFLFLFGALVLVFEGVGGIVKVIEAVTELRYGSRNDDDD